MLDIGLVQSVQGLSFSQQFWIEFSGPVAAAILGSGVVAGALYHSRTRRERDSFRADLSVEMMRVAFTFRYQIEEVNRQKAYKEPPTVNDLTAQYETFRIAARVVEERLVAHMPKDSEARWLWHAAVDLLSVSFYRLYHPGDRLNDLILSVAKHRSGVCPGGGKIPHTVLLCFLSKKDLEEYDPDIFNDKVNQRLIFLLNRANHALQIRRHWWQHWWQHFVRLMPLMRSKQIKPREYEPPAPKEDDKASVSR